MCQAAWRSPESRMASHPAWVDHIVARRKREGRKSALICKLHLDNHVNCTILKFCLSVICLHEDAELANKLHRLLWQAALSPAFAFNSLKW